MAEDRDRQPRLDRVHPIGQESEAASHHEPGETEVHGPYRHTGGQRRQEEDRAQDLIGRQAEQEAERREDQTDRDPESGHPDREVREDT